VRKGETLAQEAERKRLEAALPTLLESLTARIRKLKLQVVEAIADLSKRSQPNEGGSRNGTLQD